MNSAEEWINNLGDRIMEITQSRQQTKPNEKIQKQYKRSMG